VITLFTAGRYEAALEAAAFLTTRIFLLHAIEAACHACLGHVAAAQESLRQGFALRPDLTVSAISSLLPYRKGMDSDHLQQALRLAGLPD
jgi:adenylate cyclase